MARCRCAGRRRAAGSSSTTRRTTACEIEIHEVFARHRARAGRRPRPGQGRRRGAPAGAAGGADRAAGRGLHAGAARVPHGDRPGGHPGEGRERGAVAVEIKRRGDIDGVEQLTRYLELLDRDPLLGPRRRACSPRRRSSLRLACSPRTGASAAWCSTTTRCAASTTPTPAVLGSSCSRAATRRDA